MEKVAAEVSRLEEEIEVGKKCYVNRNRLTNVSQASNVEKSALEQAVASAKEELQQKTSEAEALQRASDEMRSQYEQRLADKREEAEAQV